MSILGKAAHVVQPSAGKSEGSIPGDVVDAAVGIIMRHPLSEAELIAMLSSWTQEKVIETLSKLEASGQAQVIERHGQRFWSYSAARHVDEQLSKRHRGQQIGDRQ